MRRKGRGCTCGWLAVIGGVFIMLALILPAWFWWLVCAGLLIYGGVWLIKS